MYKTVCLLLGIIGLWGGTTNVFCQNKTDGEPVRIESFSNNFLIHGKEGTLFLMDTNTTTNNAIVRWNNGYWGIGKIIKGKAFGKWCLYDKHNRLMEQLMFGFDAQCLLYSKKFNRKGKVVSDYKTLTPCF